MGAEVQDHVKSSINVALSPQRLQSESCALWPQGQQYLTGLQL